MISIYKKTRGMDNLKVAKTIQKGCWVNMIDPLPIEIEHVSKVMKIDIEHLTYPLDINEAPRIEHDKNFISVIFKIPHLVKSNMRFETYPLGIIIKDNCIITVCKKPNELINDFEGDKIKNFYTSMQVRFLLQLFLRSSYYYMQYLRNMEKEIGLVEERLAKIFRNEDLMSLTILEKSLLYFNTAALSNDNVMRKILTGKIVKLYENDQELMEDILIENEQAIQMTAIYRELITALRDAYSSMAANNLSDIMKFLTAITLVISIPTMIASFYGMNFQNIPMFDNPYGFIIITVFSIILAILIAMWMKRKRFL